MEIVQGLLLVMLQMYTLCGFLMVADLSDVTNESIFHPYKCQNIFVNLFYHTEVTNITI